MQIPTTILLVAIIIIGFLTGSTVYFYSKSRTENSSKVTSQKVFDPQEAPATEAPKPDLVDTQTVAAEPKGRLSYPANSYTIQPKEALATIGEKMGVSWKLIKLANGFANENIIQSGMIIVIPKLNLKTDYYRINFVVNDEQASEMNRELRTTEASEFYDPIAMAKKYAPPYFGVKVEDEFTLLEKDLSKGTALVEAKKDANISNLIGLTQPKTTGEKGIWAMLYIEHRDVSQ